MEAKFAINFKFHKSKTIATFTIIAAKNCAAGPGLGLNLTGT
jgi:hypothetical protein